MLAWDHEIGKLYTQSIEPACRVDRAGPQPHNVSNYLPCAGAAISWRLRPSFTHNFKVAKMSHTSQPCVYLSNASWNTWSWSNSTGSMSKSRSGSTEPRKSQWTTRRARRCEERRKQAAMATAPVITWPPFRVTSSSVTCNQSTHLGRFPRVSRRSRSLAPLLVRSLLHPPLVSVLTEPSHSTSHAGPGGDVRQLLRPLPARSGGAPAATWRRHEGAQGAGDERAGTVLLGDPVPIRARVPLACARHDLQVEAGRRLQAS
eukprot:1195726-Prorocentrum_minimum.AAC.4